MKKSILLLSLVLTVLSVHAQYNLTPVPSSANFQAMDFDVHADAKLHYAGSVPVVLRWNIVNIAAPKDWGIYTCLGLACYSPGQFEGVQPMVPGEEIIIQAHVLPQATCENGSYEITFTDVLTNAVVATGIFNYACLTSSIGTNNTNSKAGTIYPNPAITWFSVGDMPTASRVEMFNIIGKQVAQFTYQPSGRYDIAQLPGGMYLIRVIDQQGRVLTSKRMSKNTP